MATFVDRIIGAASLNVQIYEEVEADTSATGQALGVVVLSSIAHGIGSLGRGGPGMIWGIIIALVGWCIWAFLAYVIGTKLLPEPQTRSDVGELLRTTGFSAAPGLLGVFGVIPVAGQLILLAIAVWSLVTMVVAVRQALDYRSTGRAIAVCLIGFLVYLVLGVVLAPLGLPRA